MPEIRLKGGMYRGRIREREAVDHWFTAFVFAISSLVTRKAVLSSASAQYSLQ
jgi:hypothetical protein